MRKAYFMPIGVALLPLLAIAGILLWSQYKNYRLENTWAPPTGVGHYTIGGLQFNVPKKFLGWGKWEPDGEKSGLLLLFHYPDMSRPSRTDKVEEGSLIVSLEEIKGKRTICYEEGVPDHCYTREQYWYHGLAFIGREPPAMLDVPINSRGDVGLYSFILKDRSSPKEVFYAGGDFRRPDYWLVCNFKKGEQGEKYIRNPGCITQFRYMENLQIKYSFDKDLLNKHQRIRQAIIDKIETFIDSDHQTKKEK